MDVYSTSFTIPRASGAATFAEDELPSSSPTIPAASDQSAAVEGSNAPGVVAGLGSGASGSASLGNGFGLDAGNNSSGVAGVASSYLAGNDLSRTETARPRSSDTHNFAGRMGSMRSRLPPSVKAFMPAAFGGSKRTSERIAEAVGPNAEREGDTEGEDEASGSSAPTGASSKKTGETDAAVDKEAKPETGTGAIGTELAAATASKNRDSRSTVGTNSSVDFSSAASASADSTSPSTIPPLGSGSSTKAVGEGMQTPSEPRSTTHSASGSFSNIFGQQQQTSQGQGSQQSQRRNPSIDLNDSMHKLATETMSKHQCIVNFTAVSRQGQPTFHANGSSTSLSSDSFPRQQNFNAASATGILPFPSRYPYNHYAQGFGHDSGANAFGVAPHLFPLGGGSTTSLNSLNPPNQASAPASLAPPRPSANGSNKAPATQQYNFHLSGSYQQVMAARGAILREHPFKARSKLKVPRNDVLEILPGSPTSSTPSEHLRADVRRKLDEIAIATRTNISVQGLEKRGTDLGYGLETERNAQVAIAGPFEGAEQARIRVMVMLDEMSGLQVEASEIDCKLHNIIGGRKRCVIQRIQEETSTNIYLPTPFSDVLSSSPSPSIASRQNTIYIAGEYFGVQRARDMLFQVSLHKSKSIISRDVAILPRKIDWMLGERLEELRTIMLDNATFIKLPLLGSQTSIVSVYGDNRVNIERSIRSMMQLACQFYIASLWLLPFSFDAFQTPASLSAPQITPILKHVSNASGAEIVFKSNCFEIHGLEGEVRHAVTLILDIDAVKSFNFEVRFQIELANEHREFISGKKNGKINKIMKQGVRIKFETFNDYNFLIDVSSNDRVGALQGLSLLQEELPAEVSFHVPESYHKRIIGVGGKNIQRTMKKYGIYVKFYSKQDLDVETYPFLDAEDNVIARTPAKNAMNLDNLKQAVMELVSPKDKDYVTETVPIARRYHRSLLGEKGIFIHDIEEKLGCTIRFPPPELANDLVSIFGSESQIHIAAQMLLDHVPFEAEFRTPNSSELGKVIASHDFVALAERVKRDLNINIVPVANKTQTGEAVFKLRLNRSNADFLPASKDALEDFLLSRNVDVYDSPARARSDSFASSFPHFATKLISTAAESTDSFQTDAARYQQAQERSRLRAATSTPDIKALFDSPAQSSINNSTFAPIPSMGPGSASTTNSPLIPSSLYPSPYQDTMSSASSLGGGDVWGMPRYVPPPPPQSSHSYSHPHHHHQQHHPHHHHSSSSGITFPQHNARLSDDVKLSYNRNASDALEADERIKALRKPRSFAHRAQSLDIGALAAQQAAQQAAAIGRSGGGVGVGGVPMGGTGMHGVGGSPLPPSMPTMQRPYGAIGSSPMPSSQVFAGSSLGPNAGNASHFGPSPVSGGHMSTSSNPRMHSASTHGPEPSTTDEVLRSLAQLQFPPSS